MVLHLRTRMAHFRHGRSVPRLPPPLDFNTVFLLCPLVAALRVVFDPTPSEHRFRIGIQQRKQHCRD